MLFSPLIYAFNIGKPKSIKTLSFLYYFVCKFVAKKHMRYNMTCISFCSELKISLNVTEWTMILVAQSQRNTHRYASVPLSWQLGHKYCNIFNASM